MSRVHTPSGRWALGLGLSIITSLAFGFLPIALKGMLEILDVYTLTWYRFMISVAVLAPFIVRPGKLSTAAWPGKRLIVIVLLAGLLMSGNYLLYILGLLYVSPSTAQVVIQQASLFFLLGSLVIFREQFTGRQWVGLAIVIFGLLLFFNERLIAMVINFTEDTLGVLLITGAALIWAIYALLQKHLLKTYSASTTILLFYSIGSLAFLPFAQPSLVFQLSGVHIGLLFGLGLISLISYGAFAEALNHWEASRVSAVLATVPVITVAMVKITTALFPDFIPPESLSMLSLAGAVLVVTGSIMMALGRSR
ncbi:MAG: DMT family transporter [Candidatus Latescibacteria bacterium]|nr:DMT family transporter [Candidatus Latescibacterota bacterium]